MNLWWVLQFSAAASVVAAVILGVKLLFHDKLDARWHYLIWLVLLVRMAVPVQIDLIRTPVSLFETIPVLKALEMCGLAAHKAGLDSLTDALMWGYLAGAAAFLLYDLICYLILRLRIALAKENGGQGAEKKKKRLWKASGNVSRRVESIAQKYGLKTCRKICVQDTPTPYVCGLWRAALVLTKDMAYRLERREEAAAETEEMTASCEAADGDSRAECRTKDGRMCGRAAKAALDPDEAVLVHELLHQKYKDVLVNFVLHLARALNWFNPFLWYVAGVVQNDSEALCDQRVLECLEQSCGREAGYEKEYGMLLIHMAEGKERNPAKAGTSNMANSFQNMKTRIRRIADFKKVPPGIGLVTLCITLILSVAGIGYCQGAESLDTKAIGSEKELAYAMLDAELYEAQTPAEALYLYLAAIRRRNPVYMMAVMPESMRQDYDKWVKDNYRWNGSCFEFLDWSGQWKEKGYFPEQCSTEYAFSGFKIYNLYSENEDLSHATVLAQLSSKEEEAVLWELELLREDGFRVRKKGEQKRAPEGFEEPALFRASGQGEDFRVEVDCWNVGSFQDLEVGQAFEWYAPGTEIACENGNSQKRQLPREFSMEYKMVSDYLSYTGSRDMTGHTIGVVMLKEGENKEDHENCFQAIERGAGGGGSPLVSDYSNVEGGDLMDGGRISIGGGGVGPDRWEETEAPSWHVWIYVDRELAEEFDVRVP